MESKFNIGDKVMLKGSTGEMVITKVRISYELSDGAFDWLFDEEDLEIVQEIVQEKNLYFNKYKWIADRVKTMGSEYVAMFTWPDSLHGKLATGSVAVPEWCDER